jgi:bifunctional non-homologous end joining protein LigD
MRTDIEPRECTREEAVEEEARPAAAPLLPADKEQATVVVEGREMQLKNLNKVFYPADGVTKRDVLEYYHSVADLLIPHWKDRPLSLRRYPDGIDKEGFFQKDATGSGMPDWLRKERILAETGEMRVQVIGDTKAELVWLANLGCIDQNPWMSRVGSLDNPDFLLIDLDPQECSYDKVVDAARVIRRLLDEAGLTGCPKTTGGHGMHIYVPLEPVYTYEQARGFAELLARLVERERPDLFTLPRAVSKRAKDRVYFDYLQIGRGRTISAPYVLRAHAGAPVATPLAWSEVKPGLQPAQFNIRNALARFERTGDLFAPVLELKQRLEPALERLEGRVNAERRG